MKKRSILASLVFAASAFCAHAGDVLSLKAGHPETYVVKKGDTLWDISGMYLNKPWKWPEIWHVNPQVNNPHLIYPGDVLNLVYIDGKPRLMVNRSGGGKVKLSPKMKISDLNSAIKAIPLSAISPFMSESLVVQPSAFEKAPYVLAGKEGRIIGGAGDVFYARGQFDGQLKDYGIFRKGTQFVDPDTGFYLGTQAMFIGAAETLRFESGAVDSLSLKADVAELSLIDTREEVRRLDVLMPRDGGKYHDDFHPSAPSVVVNGKIIAVEGGVTQVGTMDVVVINRGEIDGVKAGNVLSIWRTGKVVQDHKADEMVKLPDVEAGMMMVFRTFEKVSYGLVLKAEMPLSTLDTVKNPK